MLAVGMVGNGCNHMIRDPVCRIGHWPTYALMAVKWPCARRWPSPNAGALMSRAIDEHRQGQIMGLNNACGAFARFAGPSGAAFVYSAISVDGPYFLGALVVAPAILLALAAGKAAGRV